MSIITGRRLNSFYKKAFKPIKEKIEAIEKKLENVLSPTEIDKYIFSDSKSGFVPKTVHKYDKEFRYLRADGKWVNPAENDVIVTKRTNYIDAQYEDATGDIILSGAYNGGIMLITVDKKRDIGSMIGAAELLASYAYSVAIGSKYDTNMDSKEVVKIAALSSGLSSTYGTISAVNESDKENYAVVRIKAKKGYQITVKLIV